MFEPTVIEDFRQRLSGVISAGTEEEEEEDVNMAAFASVLESESAALLPVADPPTAAPEPEIPPVSTPAKPGFKSGGFKPSFQPSAFNEVLPDAEPEDDVDGAPMEDVDGDAVDVDGDEVDVDGEEVDVDGEAVDVDGEEMPLEDVDGEPAPMEVQRTETVVIEDDVMDLAQSDDDIF